MSRSNKTRSIKWHKTCKCICRLNGIICNNKQWNKEKCRCECEKLIDKEVCDKGYIFNPSYCKCECDSSCNISQYLDYSDCKCKKKLVHLLIEECTENTDETKLVNITITKNNNETKLVNITIAAKNNETKLVNITIAENENSQCNSCKVYIVLMIVAIVISTGVTIYFVYCNWFLIKNNIICTKFNLHKETLIY